MAVVGNIGPYGVYVALENRDGCAVLCCAVLCSDVLSCYCSFVFSEHLASSAVLSCFALGMGRCALYVKWPSGCVPYTALAGVLWATVKAGQHCGAHWGPAERTCMIDSDVLAAQIPCKHHRRGMSEQGHVAVWFLRSISTVLEA